ncbi:MAG: isoprenylcysteine carboxylmethyltransferase family protein [Gemmatimonadetes bacterium]|nr:isoprenylcysteine carboxylmethyltransferase family protein [Gemmatimonadota bacterium]
MGRTARGGRLTTTAKTILDLLVPAWVASEVLLGVLRRARGEGDQRADQGSSPLLWGVILGSVACAVLLRLLDVGGTRAEVPALAWGALALLGGGLALRWWAIITLGRLFTMTLAVRRGHELVTAGPYRWVRHPAYAGMLLAFAGCGLWMENWLSLAALLVPIGGVVLHRIHVEEAILNDALGDPYRRYRDRTKRLVPWVF